MMFRHIVGLALVLATASGAFGHPDYSSGNILLAHYSETLDAQALLEYTPAGSLVREVEIPAPPGVEDFVPRDLVIDKLGRIHVVLRSHAAGGGNLILASLGTGGAPWSFQTPADWSNKGVTYYGAIGINSDYIFCPDQTFGSDDSEGILRFPLDDLGAPEHFSFPGWNFHAVKVGLDGFVYAINRYGDVAWFHPDTMEMYDRLPRGKLFRDASVINFAVDAGGTFFTVDLDDVAHRIDRSGRLLETLDVGGALGDIEISAVGDLLISGANRSVLLSDVGFVPPSEFLTEVSPDPSSWMRSFLTFTEPPTIPKPTPDAPAIVSIGATPGRFTMTVASRTGLNYYLERSTDLRTWLRLQPPKAGTGAELELEDLSLGLPGSVSYRVACEFAVPVS